MLQIGKKAPPFNLASDSGKNVSLADYQGSRLLVFFYAKDNTSGWTTEALEFQERIADFAKLNIKIIGISKDSVQSHAKFRDKLNLDFPLLSDPDHTVMEAYDAWGEKKMYGKTVQGTLRSTVIIDPVGNVEKIYTKVKAKGHAQQVLEDLQ